MAASAWLTMLAALSVLTRATVLTEITVLTWGGTGAATMGWKVVVLSNLAEVCAL